MSEVERIKAHIKKLEAQRDLGDRAMRLNRNTDFKKLILEDFCVTNCARHAQLSADPALQPENRADSLALAQAAGHLRRYLSVICQMANKADGDLEEARAMLAQAMSGDAEVEEDADDTEEGDDE